MEISWTKDNQLKIITDVETFKTIQDDAYYLSNYKDELDKFVRDDFASTQVDLEQSTHPGINKNYDVKLDGYDLELIEKVSKRIGNGRINEAFYNLVEKLRTQVPYVF